MRPEGRKHVFDMISAVRAVTQFAEGKTRKDYETDLLLRSAIERQLQILGEALIRLRRVDPESVDQISRAREIVGFRNVVVHAYDQVSESVVWSIVEHYLPPLLRELQTLLERTTTER